MTCAGYSGHRRRGAHGANPILAKPQLGEDIADERVKVRERKTVALLIDGWSKDGVLTNRRTGALRSKVNVAGEIALAIQHIRPLVGRRTPESLTKGYIQRLRTPSVAKLHRAWGQVFVTS